MNNVPTLFQFESKNIRVVTDEHGEPLFVGKDICDALGYANATDALNDHCRWVAKRYPIPDGIGRIQDTRVLTEPDVLRLIMKSTLPAAEAFERLVFEEILPTIRKTGSYTAKPASKLNPRIEAAKEFTSCFRIAKLIGCDRNAAAISANNAVYQNTGVNLLSLLGQTHLDADKQALFFNVSDLQAGISGVKMNKMLEAAGLQVRGNDRWEPTEQG